jgi:alpha-1,2-mannosyltransferase
MQVLSTLFVALGASIFAWAAAAGLTGSLTAASVLAALAGALVGFLYWRHPIVVLDESACSPGLKVVSCAATLVALVVVARLAVFMVDPSQASCSVLPGSNWEVQHNCLTAYYVAAAAAPTRNIYDDTLYTQPNDNPAAPRRPLKLGIFNIDVYEYPPPFLLLPRALAALVPDFMRLRALWFGLNAGVILLALLLVARSLGPTIGTRAFLLCPLVWASICTPSTLQKGNVQLTVIALAMIAMLLFERRRWAAGGVLLAFVTLSKLYPGMLIVYLLVRRQWQALAWTAGASVLLLGLSLADTGWAPYTAFLQHLPGLLGGEAFPAFRNPAAIAINLSVPGLVFKLKLFGVPGMSFTASKILGWIYTIAVLAATVALARRPPKSHEAPLAWLAILILATLRSPFLPQTYATFPGFWLLTLLAATFVPTARVLALTVLGWLVLNVLVPIDSTLDPRLTAVITLVPQVLMAGLALVVLRRREGTRTIAR